MVEHVVAQETTIRATHRREAAVASATAFPIPIRVWNGCIYGSARDTRLKCHYFIASAVARSFTGTLVPAIPTPVLGRPAVVVDSLNQSTPAHLVFAVAEDFVALARTEKKLLMVSGTRGAIRIRLACLFAPGPTIPYRVLDVKGQQTTGAFHHGIPMRGVWMFLTAQHEFCPVPTRCPVRQKHALLSGHARP